MSNCLLDRYSIVLYIVKCLYMYKPQQFTYLLCVHVRQDYLFLFVLVFRVFVCSISGDKYCRLCVVFIFHRYRFCLLKQRPPTTTEDAAGPHSFKYITIVINTLFFYNTIALKDSRNTSISTSVIFCTKQSLVTASSQLIATLGRHLPSYS